ncbi:MAG TPA: hypothetical protein VI357_20495 [Mycobacteriales bacterium]
MTTLKDTVPDEPAISPEEIEARRAELPPTEKIIFAVAGLYGFSTRSVEFPVSATESIESGQIATTLDPESRGGNVGMIDFDRRYLRVTYDAVAVFPGIHDLVMSGKHDLSLLGPVRVTATDECAVSEDFSGWRALGCLDFQPGSLWAGAKGG